MADNFDFTEGSGKTGAADDVSNVLYPRVKLDIGTDGVGTPCLGGAGAVAAGVQRITLASNDPAVALLTTIDSDTNTIQGDTTSIDGKITACNTGAVVLATGSAAIGKLAANDGVDIGNVDVTSVVPGVAATSLGKARDSALGGTDTGVMALAVRDDTLTTLTPADGDYVPLRVGSTGKLHVTDANITACNTGAVVISSGTITTVSTVTTCSTVTAVTSLDKSVYVDDADWTDNTSSHTLVGGVYQSSPHTVTDGDVSPFQLDVNGKIIESNSAAIATSLAIIDDWDDANYCNVNLNLAGTDAGNGESALDGTELRVTIATDDDGVAHLATIAGAVAATHMQCDIIAGTVTTVSTVTNLAQMGGTAITMDEGVHGTGVQRVTIATDDDGVLSLGIIDDWDATHASAASADGPQIMGAGYSTGLPTDVGADGDAARICTDRYGRVLRGIMPQNFVAIFDSSDASAEANTVKAKTASRKIYILSLTISVDAEMWVKLQKEDSTAITPKFWLKAGGGLTKTYPPEAPLVVDTANVDLEVITEGAGEIGVEVTGYLAV